MHTAIIIDDSKTSRSVLRTILEKNGYEIVAEAANGEEGKMVDAIKLGAAEFVTKPFETDQIISIIESIEE